MILQRIFKGKKTYLIPIIGFAIIILIGTILLSLPFSNYGNVSLKDRFFTSIAGLTTTGFLKAPIISQYTFFGQLVLTILMEIGGLGFIIFISYFWSIKHKKINISDMIVINDSIGSESFGSIRDHSIFIFKLMLRVQMLGILLLSFRFIPIFGFFKGIWYSIFHSISAFSNTGFELFTGNSFYNLKNDSYAQLILISLMIIGSIGILVIEDLKNNKQKKFSKLKLQTKIVLTYSIVLLLVPTILFSLEPNVSWLNSFFMSASCRSTGFSVVDFESFSVENKILLILLMFIGGAPASTSGGIKLVVLAIVISTIIATLKGKNETVIFWKRISESSIKKSFTILMLFITLLMVTSFIFYHFNKIDMLDIIFDSVSAITNTGLSIINFDELNLVGETILMFLMFVGRVGPLSLVLTFIHENKADKFIEYPTEEVIL